jgi:hypothetical protein
VSGGIRRGMRCPEGCPIVASIVDAGHETPDTTAWTWTGTRLVDVRASSMGAGGHGGWVPVLVAAGVGRRRACALSSCPVMARMSGQRGWPWSAGQAHGRTLGGGGVRRLAVAVRTGSIPIGWAATLTGMSGRSRGPPCPSPGQPLPGVRRRNWSAETVSRRVSGDCTLAEAGGQPDCGHVRHATGEVLEVPTGRSRVGARADERLRRGDLLPPPIGPMDECGGGVGHWVSVSGSRPSALAGRGLCSAVVIPSRRRIARHVLQR